MSKVLLSSILLLIFLKGELSQKTYSLNKNDLLRIPLNEIISADYDLSLLKIKASEELSVVLPKITHETSYQSEASQDIIDFKQKDVELIDHGASSNKSVYLYKLKDKTYVKVKSYSKKDSSLFMTS